MTKEDNKEADHSQRSISEAIKKHSIIILYILQLLMVLMYMEAEIQPFVYVRF